MRREVTPARQSLCLCLGCAAVVVMAWWFG